MNAKITVLPLDQSTWRVEVNAATSTSHEVTIPAGYLAQLGLDGVAPERVLEASFRFLLEREPNTSILRRFTLSTIADYFPQYERAIGKRVAK